MGLLEKKTGLEVKVKLGQYGEISINRLEFVVYPFCLTIDTNSVFSF